MTVRRLEQKEHGRTRALWEEVFSEDTKAFLDYYYYIKTRDNQIYVVEEEGQICSMLHLNPYLLKMEDSELPAAYIVAVSTREEYRGRGYMNSVLKKALNDMYSEKIAFTFLMPAAEAIYTPYDFRFIYSQSIAELETENAEKETTGGSFRFEDAAVWNAEEMAEFFNSHFLGKWQVYAVRDNNYYQTMIMEQQSEKGGVRLIRDDGILVGLYAYAAEEGLEIREPLYLPEYESAFLSSVYELEKTVAGKRNDEKRQEKIKIYACPEHMESEKKPAIMARIVNLKEFMGSMKVAEELDVDCCFAVIDPLIHQNSSMWRITSHAGETKLTVCETEESEGVMTVDVLTELMFGRMDTAVLSEIGGVRVTPRLAEELGKISKLTKVFLNEVV